MSKDNTHIFFTMEGTNNEIPKPGTEAFNQAAKDKILTTRGVWAPAEKLPQETDMSSGADTIRCIKPDFWDD